MSTELYTLFSVLPCMVCLFWSLILIVDWADSDRATHILLWFSLTCTALYACHAVHFLCALTSYPKWIDCLWSTCNLGVYPLFYIYIRYLTDVHGPSRRIFWVLIPSLVTVILSSAVAICGLNFDIVRMFNTPVFAAEVIYTAVYGRRRLIRYRERISSFYADTDDKNLEALDRILALLVITSIASMSVNALGRDNFSGAAITIPSIAFSALLFGIFMWGHRHHFSAENFKLEIENTDKNIETGTVVSDDFHDILYQRICKLMEDEKLFLNKDLKITELATRIGTNRTYVSSCINHHSGVSFSDFIHRYRIEYAMTILAKDKETSMAEVAELSGYKSGNSFYKAFVKINGITPTKWMESH